MAVQYMVKPKDGDVFKVAMHENRVVSQVTEARDMGIYSQMQHQGQGSTYVTRVQGRVQEFKIFRLPYHGNNSGDEGCTTTAEPLCVDTQNAIAHCIGFEQELSQLHNMTALS